METLKKGKKKTEKFKGYEKGEIIFTWYFQLMGRKLALLFYDECQVVFLIHVSFPFSPSLFWIHNQLL